MEAGRWEGSGTAWSTLPLHVQPPSRAGDLPVPQTPKTEPHPTPGLKSVHPRSAGERPELGSCSGGAGGDAHYGAARPRALQALGARGRQGGSLGSCRAGGWRVAAATALSGWVMGRADSSDVTSRGGSLCPPPRVLIGRICCCQGACFRPCSRCCWEDYQKDLSLFN